MKQNFYWKKFAESGSVLDYLCYKEAERQKQKNKKDFKKQQKTEM